MTKPPIVKISDLSEQPVQPRGLLDKHKAKQSAPAVPNKVGRPKKDRKEKMVPITLYLPPDKAEQVKENAGLVKLSTHLLDYLERSGYFKK